MKISMELNVSDKEFYDLMMKSLKEEVKNVTKKNLELKEGLKYKKKSAQRKGIGSEITVHIKRLIPNTLYEATFVTERLVHCYKYGYRFRVYEEIYENVSPKEIPVWRQKMAEKQSAKKSKKMFKEVEKFILNERNNKN